MKPIELVRLIPALSLTMIVGCTSSMQVSNHESHGWSSNRLQEVAEASSELGTAVLLIYCDGSIVFEYGDTTQNYRMHSIRKSLLNALIGIAVNDNKISLSATLEELDINEKTTLTHEEKQATVADLLMSRSGVYLPAASETSEARDSRPERGINPPGSHWYYNNWDFNALGTIYEQQTGVGIFDAFRAQIATPLGMQDFSLTNTRYQLEPSSIHPSYKFRMSARDLARFGQLYLQRGRWGDLQIIRSDWIDESTTAYSDTGRKGTKSGYGYMFWIASADEPDARGIPKGAYTASGTGGQRLIILPSINTVIVHLVDTDVRGEPRMRSSQFDQLLKAILSSKNEKN